MTRKLITCPETAHLEQIEYEGSTDGFRVIACSRFAPCDRLACSRLCEIRMNRRADAEREDRKACEPADGARAVCAARQIASP
jgi:hypothetical protein